MSANPVPIQYRSLDMVILGPYPAIFVSGCRLLLLQE
jgi:hypothetical protein